jgi:hypothetical protein
VQPLVPRRAWPRLRASLAKHSAQVGASLFHHVPMTWINVAPADRPTIAADSDTGVSGVVAVHGPTVFLTSTAPVLGRHFRRGVPDALGLEVPTSILLLADEVIE